VIAVRSFRRLILQGLTVLLALFVAYVVGINVYRHHHRSAMTRTLWLLTGLHSELEAYAVTNGRYPPCSDAACLADTFPNLNAGRFRGLDGWGRPLHVDISAASYLISSFGRDAQRDSQWRGPLGDDVPAPEPARFDDDLVLSNGTLLQYPWGTLAGWTAPAWGKDLCGLSQAGCGVLHVEIAFDHWPAPALQLCDGHSLLAEIWRPGPVTFRAPAGTYTVAVYWPDRRRVSLTPVTIERDLVSAIDIEAPSASLPHRH